VALAVFSLVILSASSTFTTIFNSWQRQRDYLDLIKDASWALQFITNEVHLARRTGLRRLRVYSGGRRISFWIDSDGNGSSDTRVWYWKTASGSVLYRGEGFSFFIARISPDEIVTNLTNNPSGNPIFSLSSGVLSIELTLAKGTKSFTAYSRAKVRNR